MKNLWVNLPIPEAFVGGLVSGAALHVVAARPISRRHRLLRGAGLVLLPAGLLLIAWALVAARDVTIERPTALVTRGPYAVSRHPMYVAWALCSAGISLLANSLWLVAATIAAGLYHHFVEIPREEEQLLALFGDEYRSYRRQTRRYF